MWTGHGQWLVKSKMNQHIWNHKRQGRDFNYSSTDACPDNEGDDSQLKCPACGKPIGGGRQRRVRLM
jgi:hypothetical protein